ncbi:MAG: MFS transporter [Gammaproteobacteria bacterium]
MSQPDDRRARRNVVVLFTAHAILGAQMPVNIILGGLAGFLLADNKALATLPISVMLLVTMCMTGLASMFMGRYGRRLGFLLGTTAGATGGVISTIALMVGSFELLLLGTAFTGAYQSTQGYFRFAAADTASEKFGPKAISWVLAGGLVAAVLGPEVVRTTADLFDPVPYAGAYASVVILNFVGSFCFFFLDIPKPKKRDPAADGVRPLGEIFRQRTTLVAVVCAMASYGIMALVMTSTSLAMGGQGFTTGQAADVVRWHAIAMFAPSFFTGSIILRFGHLRVIGAGLVFLTIAGAIAISGVELEYFYVSLIALGFGWNFGFVGSTSLLGTTHSSAERAKVQGINDFFVFGLVAFASFISGALLHGYGWTTVQFAMIPALLLAAFALLWLAASAPEPLHEF